MRAGWNGNLSRLWTPSTRVYAVLLLLNSADGLVTTIISAYLQTLGYHVVDIGFLVAVIGVASLVSRLPAGRLAESAHPRAWFIGAAATFAATLLLYPFATEPTAFWVVRIVHGLSFGVASTLNFAAFLGLSEGTGAHRARATVLYTTAMAAGYSLGNFMGGFVADGLGFAAAFQLSALNVLGALFLSAPSTMRPVPTPDSALAPGLWRTLLLHRDIRAVPLFHFSANFLNNLVGTLFPLYVLSVGQTLSIVGTGRGLQSLTNVFARPFGGILMRKINPLVLGAGGVALTGAAIACVPFTTVPLIYFVLFVVSGIGRAGAILAGALRTTELADRGVLRRGTASALMTAGGDLGGILSPIIAGATAALIGVPAALQIIPLGLTLLLLLALAPRDRIAPPHPMVATVDEDLSPPEPGEAASSAAGRRG